jgi:hypothetical protein
MATGHSTAGHSTGCQALAAGAGALVLLLLPLLLLLAPPTLSPSGALALGMLMMYSAFT